MTINYETLISELIFLLQNKSNEIIEICPQGNEINHDEPVSSFLKTVLPSSDTDSCVIPGLGDAADGLPEPILHNDYRPSMLPMPMTPMMGRMMSIPNTPMSNLNHSLMGHSTPLLNRNLNGEPHTPSPYSSENSQNNASAPSSFEPAISTPLPPPPMPPIEFLDDNNCYNKLPPKFPTWTFANETPKEPIKWTEDKGIFTYNL